MGQSPPPSSLLLTSSVVPADGRRIRIMFHGEIDMSTTDDLTAAVLAALRAHRPAQVDLDLAGVRFMDSSGIHALIRCHARAGESGCRLTVTNPHPIVHRILAVTELLDLFGIPAASRPAPGRETPVESSPLGAGR